MLQIRIKPGVEERISSFYQWIYRAEISSYSRKPKKGEHVTVRDSNGRFLGYGYINPSSNIAVRILSFYKTEKINKELIRAKISQALSYREKLNIPSNAYRLIHSEGDLLPGLIVDVYDRYVVVEFTTYGMYLIREWVFDALIEVLSPLGIYQKCDKYVQKVEGFECADLCVYGYVPKEVTINEHDLKFLVNIQEGQKTGFYLDQRGARQAIRKFVSNGDRCLDVFCHTGGFALSMKKKGAREVIGVDLSSSALEVAEKNEKLNGLTGIKWVKEDAFDFLKRMQKENEKFDVVVIDPPSFARTKTAVESAMRGYKDLCLRGLHITKPGGYMAVFSCSFHIGLDHLLKAVASAAKDARKQVRIVDVSFQDLDHPWVLQMPNTLYLKGLYLEVLS